jgi:hypothetical protein
MVRKPRNSKSGSTASFSKKPSKGRSHARPDKSAHPNNRRKNPRPNVPTQSFSTRNKNSNNRRLIPSKRCARENYARERSLSLLSDLRRGEASYSELLRKHHLDTRTARKYLGRNLIRGTGRKRVRASKSDTLVRLLLFPAATGDIPKLIRGSDLATQLSEYFHDRGKLRVNKLSPENFEAKWRGVIIAGQEVFADAATILLRAHAGDLKIDDLYASGGGGE